MWKTKVNIPPVAEIRALTEAELVQIAVKATQLKENYENVSNSHKTSEIAALLPDFSKLPGQYVRE